MADFDVDAYYVEQDARMNQPDETVDQFRERLSAFNRSQGFNYASTSMIPEARRSLSSISTLHEEVGSLSINDSNDRDSDAGNKLKRKASLQQLESPGKRPNIASASVEKEDNLCGDVPPEINQLSRRSFQNLQPPDKPTSDMEEMDSFTVLTSDPPNASTTESVKSKSIPTTLSQSPRRNKYLQDHGSKPQPSPEPPTADFSPISSFSRSINHSPEKRRREEVILIPNKKELDLRPLHEVTVTRRPSRNKLPPSSPIEDPSAIFSDQIN